ncbi:hypothetical protein D3C75_1024590 [compost metagenome]
MGMDRTLPGGRVLLSSLALRKRGAFSPPAGPPPALRWIGQPLLLSDKSHNSKNGHFINRQSVCYDGCKKSYIEEEER